MNTHEELAATSNNECCFNHLLGLPQKWNTDLPIFAWQQTLYDALQDYKHIWIKKSTGLGATEFMLRYLAWAIVNNHFKQGARACIVTGPRVDLAVTLIDRFKMLFSKYFYMESRNTVAVLNGCTVAAFPSHHLNTMRGLTDVKFILLDEADFFPIGEQQNARDISERYIAKSEPWIIMVSTPNAPEGLFERIEREGPDCLYHRIYLPYTIGLPNEADPLNIYSEDEIKRQRVSPSFEREYNLKYLGRIGNVFHSLDIEQALVTKEYGAEMLAESSSPFYGRSMGIDPAWGTTSNFGIVITQKRNGRAEIFHAEEISQPRMGPIIDHIMQLKQRHHVTKIYVDAANPEVIRELKERCDDVALHFQNIDEDLLWQMRRGDMQIIPINFKQRHRQMLQWAVILMQKHMVRIHPDLTKLIVAMRTAIAIESDLKKEETSYCDVFDAFRLALLNYDKPAPRD